MLDLDEQIVAEVFEILQAAQYGPPVTFIRPPDGLNRAQRRKWWYERRRKP